MNQDNFFIFIYLSFGDRDETQNRVGFINPCFNVGSNIMQPAH
jgi:hypothetical protein